MANFRVLCTLPNASASINGVNFVRTPAGMLSDIVSHETARKFSAIPGYRLLLEDSAGRMQDGTCRGRKRWAPEIFARPGLRPEPVAVRVSGRWRVGLTEAGSLAYQFHPLPPIDVPPRPVELWELEKFEPDPPVATPKSKAHAVPVVARPRGRPRKPPAAPATPPAPAPVQARDRFAGFDGISALIAAHSRRGG